MKQPLSLKNFLTTVLLLCSFVTYADGVAPVSVNVTTAGTLSTLIDPAKKLLITDLTVTGPLNGTDIRYIREMAGRNVEGKPTDGKLLNLDLSGANIVAGGDCYLSHPSNNLVTEKDWISIYMFQGCIGLKTIKLPTTLSQINSDAFSMCIELTSITIPDGVKIIGSGAFSSCYKLTSIILPKNLQNIYAYTFFCCENLTSINIPESVTSIGDNAFFRCKSLTSITIPDRVTTIGNAAFYGCKGLNSITIPKNILSLGGAAFDSCTNASSIYYYAKNSSQSSSPAFSPTTVERFIIGDSVTYIPQYLFSDLKKLTSINLPNSITEIGNNAFRNCTGLTSINIPNRVTTIGGNAFYCCFNLTTVTLPNSLTKIRAGAFLWCTALKSITIPENVKGLEWGTFNSCKSLSEIHCQIKNAPKIASDFFFDIDPNCQLFVPVGSSEIYKNTAIWKDFTSIREEDAASAPQTKATKTTVYTTRDAIVVTGAACGETVYVYNLSGVLLNTATVTEELTKIQVSANNHYLVKVGSQTFKVSLK
jgi:hypothetical protein